MKEREEAVVEKYDKEVLKLMRELEEQVHASSELGKFKKFLPKY